MKSLIRPACILLYFLSIVLFFLMGILYAGWIGAGESQGLAAAAIVLGYGFFAAFIALLGALFMAYTKETSFIIIINKVFGAIVAVLIFYFVWNYHTNVKPKRDGHLLKNETHSPRITTSQFGFFSGISFPVSRPLQSSQVEAGLGMFFPDMAKEETIYFYGDVGFNLPVDSITIQKSSNHQPIISAAPPWLYPEHLKLDYGLFAFKVVSMTRDAVEVVVNKSTGQTHYVQLTQGDLKLWPEFLLHVHSIELIDPVSQQIHIKPLSYSSSVLESYDILRPIRITDEWMEVQLLSMKEKPKGTGWIKWKSNGVLQITYSLLS